MAEPRLLHNIHIISVEMENNLEDLEKEITCAVCHEHFRDPKILPCLHYYCKMCILKLALRTATNQPFSCPECRVDTALPEGGVDELRSAFFVNRLKSVYDKLKKSTSSKACCEMCNGWEIRAEAFCQQCNKFACRSCIHMHSEMKAVFGSHKFLPVGDLHKLKDCDLKFKKAHTQKCKDHEVLKVFCLNCNRFIFRDSVPRDHHLHDILSSNEIADSKKKELEDHLKPLRELKNSLCRVQEEICNTEHKVKAQEESLSSTIETSFEEMHAILEKRKHQLLEEVRNKISHKSKSLREQANSLSVSIAGVRSVVEYTEQCIHHCTDEEIVSKHPDIVHQIKQEMPKLDKLRFADPVEEADVDVEIECAVSLRQLCQEKAKIIQLPAIVMVNKIRKPVWVGEESVVTLRAELEDHTPTSRYIAMEIQMKAVHNGVSGDTKIEHRVRGEYRILHTPKSRGRHELSITADGRPILGSPFPVFVSISPAQFGFPLRVWRGVAYPFSIAINSVGNIIVGQLSGVVVIVDRDGKRQATIQGSQHQMECLRGVALDNEDNLYVIDYTSNKIGKSTKNYSKFKVTEVSQVYGPGCLDIAVVGSEVMVTGRYNQGQITVYDKDMKYRRSITGRDKTRLRCVCPDRQGDLYVSDEEHNIHVLSNAGQCLRSFDDVNQLMDPWMVHVCGQYVHVADYALKKTVVFTVEGNYVTTFGCYGGMAVDIDGFIYMCDYAQSRLHCY